MSYMTYKLLSGLGLNRMSYKVLSLQLRCICVSKRQRRCVYVEANLDKNPLPRDQKLPGKFHPDLTHPPHTLLPGA